jgi:hypothetical protein
MNISALTPLKRVTAHLLLVALAPFTFDGCVSLATDARVEALRRPTIRDGSRPRGDGQCLVGGQAHAQPVPLGG